MWSPSGDRIVYQRVCGVQPFHLFPCREQHDVVVLTPGSTSNEATPAGSEVVLPGAVTGGPDGPEVWWPFEVSWSPDEKTLLYVAWSEALSPSQTSRSASEGGLVLVDPNASAPPVLLHTGNIRVVAAGGPLRIPGTSWGRLP